MSATNRGAVRSEHDFYRTDPWVVECIIPEVKRRFRALDAIEPRRTPFRILDAGAGDGRIANVMRKTFPNAEIFCVEINPTNVAKLRLQGFETHWADYLDWSPVFIGRGGIQFDLIIGNPPYTLARDFVETSLRWRAALGSVVQLLGISFMGSRGRSQWHRTWKPDVHVISPRPSFSADGKSDARDYAWWFWDNVSEGSWTTVEGEIP